MSDWLAPLLATLSDGKAAVLVTVVHAVGSTPREAGATMLVGPVTAGSIGGGRLEWLATSAAQALLEVGGRRGTRRLRRLRQPRRTSPPTSPLLGGSDGL